MRYEECDHALVECFVDAEPSPQRGATDRREIRIHRQSVHKHYRAVRTVLESGWPLVKVSDVEGQRLRGAPDMPHRRKKGIYREVPAPEAQPFDAVWNVSIEANVLR